jgi:putative transposase
VSVAGFIAAQRARHGVPHATSCRALEVSQACALLVQLG